MLPDELVKLADTFLEADAASLQGIEDAGDIAVVVAGAIGIGEGILPVERFGLVAEVPQLLGILLRSHRPRGQAE